MTLITYKHVKKMHNAASYRHIIQQNLNFLFNETLEIIVGVVVGSFVYLPPLTK